MFAERCHKVCLDLQAYLHDMESRYNGSDSYTAAQQTGYVVRIDLLSYARSWNVSMDTDWEPLSVHHPCKYASLVGGLPFTARARMQLLAFVDGAGISSTCVCLRWFPVLVTAHLRVPNTL